MRQRSHSPTDQPFMCNTRRKTVLAGAVTIAFVTVAAGFSAVRSAALEDGSSTAGGPASIEAENSLAGTTDWKEQSNSHIRRIAAYVSSEFILPGQEQRLYFRALRGESIRVEVFRLGYYGGNGGRRVLTQDGVPVFRQPACKRRSGVGLVECDWKSAYAFTLPREIPSGLFLIKITSPQRGEGFVPFVSGSRTPTPMIAQIPTATYQAYNAWGGASLYRFNRRNRRGKSPEKGVEVSFDRPYNSCRGAVCQLVHRDVAMVRFLEQHGYPVSYTTNQGAQRKARLLRQAHVVVDIGHSEYWSSRLRDGFEKARDSGTDLAFFSSNTMWKRIVYGRATKESGAVGKPLRRVLYYASRPNAFHAKVRDRSRYWKFRDYGARLSGTSWALCVGRTRAHPGVSTYRTYRGSQYYDWHPARRLRPEWLYRSTGFLPNSTVKSIVGDEPDRIRQWADTGARLVGHGRLRCQSTGEEVRTGSRAVGQSALYRAGSGAIVFSSGTMGWPLGLAPPQPGPRERTPDPRLVALTNNLLTRMACRKPRSRGRGPIVSSVALLAEASPPCRDQAP